MLPLESLPRRGAVIGRAAQTWHAFVALEIAVLASATPVQADVDVRLIEGKGFPACVAITAALRKMSPKTELLAWSVKLPSIHGIVKPHWTVLDPKQHLDAIRSLKVQNRQRWDNDQRPADVIWLQLAPDVDNQIRAGQLKMEETTVRGVEIGANPYGPGNLSTDIRFVRIGSPQMTSSFEGPYRLDPTRTFVSWSFMAASASRLPEVHNAVVDFGLPAEDMLLIAGQPWFIKLPSSLGTIWQANDLALHTLDGSHSIYSTEECLFDFPMDK